MDAQQIINRFGRRLFWCALGAVLALSPGTGSADQCTEIGSPCEYQLQSAVTYSGLLTQTPIYFCTAGTAFDKNDAAWQVVNATIQCFSVLEAPVLEVAGNFAGTITNRRLDNKNFQIQICCCPAND